MLSPSLSLPTGLSLGTVPTYLDKWKPPEASKSTPRRLAYLSDTVEHHARCNARSGLIGS